MKITIIIETLDTGYLIPSRPIEVYHWAWWTASKGQVLKPGGR